jgi:hypothetical protein
VDADGYLNGIGHPQEDEYDTVRSGALKRGNQICESGGSLNGEREGLIAPKSKQ